MSTLGKRWSTLDLEEARRLYEAGMSFREVGERLGFAPSYIAARFRRDGVPCRAPGRPLPTPAPEVDPAEIVRRKQGGESFIAIAADLGISRDMARDRYLLASGLPRRAPKSHVSRPKQGD
ncbi:helix-turn-helix domain-containing protein [Microlunatus sagamiharensis]|uniref:helix-turn-helix domain-containing protein n=1 Tax=Microlunatus sagamiharensis TaxID=546874 RepID=UPI0012FE2382|nr:helix-turn-helix domain-containing protein [Microlunatus sagamiharensis]